MRGQGSFRHEHASLKESLPPQGADVFLYRGGRPVFEQLVEQIQGQRISGIQKRVHPFEKIQPLDRMRVFRKPEQFLPLPWRKGRDVLRGHFPVTPPASCRVINRGGEISRRHDSVNGYSVRPHHMWFLVLILDFRIFPENHSDVRKHTACPGFLRSVSGGGGMSGMRFRQL